MNYPANMCSSGAYTGQPKSSFCLTHETYAKLLPVGTHITLSPSKKFSPMLNIFIVQGWNMLDLYVQGWNTSYTLNSLCNRSSKSCTQSIGIKNRGCDTKICIVRVHHSIIILCNGPKMYYFITYTLTGAATAANPSPNPNLIYLAFPRWPLSSRVDFYSNTVSRTLTRTNYGFLRRTKDGYNFRNLHVTISVSLASSAS